jgi:hypothetical protein
MFTAIISEVARNMASMHNLIDTDGIAWCWKCGANHALMPSLHCPICLGEAYHRLGIIAPQCVNQKQNQRTLKETGT